ncbi:unnamed protein product [Rhizophagus irregularis]|nr:unnamed protein product [Rhizophagus irregularis]
MANRDAYDRGVTERSPLIDQQPRPINNFRTIWNNNPVPRNTNTCDAGKFCEVCVECCFLLLCTFITGGNTM